MHARPRVGAFPRAADGRNVGGALPLHVCFPGVSTPGVSTHALSARERVRVRGCGVCGSLRGQLWDTAGEERFYSLSKSYFRGSHVRRGRRACGAMSPTHRGPSLACPALPCTHTHSRFTRPFPQCNVSGALPCHALPRPATPCHALPRPATPCHALPRPATPCHALPRPAMLCPTRPCPAVSSAARGIHSCPAPW